MRNLPEHVQEPYFFLDAPYFFLFFLPVPGSDAPWLRPFFRDMPLEG